MSQLYSTARPCANHHRRQCRTYFGSGRVGHVDVRGLALATLERPKAVLWWYTRASLTASLGMQPLGRKVPENTGGEEPTCTNATKSRKGGRRKKRKQRRDDTDLLVNTCLSWLTYIDWYLDT